MTHHTAQHLNTRNHRHGAQVTDRDGDTWTRIKTSHGTYWEHDGGRYRDLPELYEPYTYSSWKEAVDAWKEAFNTELAEHVDTYLKTQDKLTQDPKPASSRGLYQTIPPTWTKPTNLLPKPTPTSTHNMLKAAQHIFGIDPATGNAAHGIGWEELYRYYNVKPDNQHAHWAPNQKQISIEHNTAHPTRTPRIQGMTTKITAEHAEHAAEPTQKRFIIAIEGIDGAGKNTTTKQLAKLLNATTITFPQYGKTNAAKQITQHLKNPTLNPWHAAQLFAQDRAQTPLPSSGTIIIDRYTASNAAYLKAKTGDPHALQAIEDLEHTTLKLPTPDLYILIDTPVDTAMHRTKQRANTNGEEPDTNETDRELQHKVRETYLHMAQTNWTSPWIVINPHTTKD